MTCRTLFSIQDRDNGKNDQLYVFRSYEQHGHRSGQNPYNPGPADDVEIWKAGRATSAAPPFLKSMRIGNHEYEDGALGYNDPSDEFYYDILIREGLYADSPEPLSLFLTLGTGLKPTIRERTQSRLASEKHLKRLIRLFHKVSGAATRSRQTERHMQMLTGNGSFQYKKWDGGEKVGGLSLDKCKPRIFDLMEEWVGEYTNQTHIREEMKEVAALLVTKRRERQILTEDRWERFTFCTMVRCPLAHCTDEQPRRIFRTRGEAKRHARALHGDRLSNPDAEVDQAPLIQPWMRGPLGHWADEELMVT